MRFLLVFFPLAAALAQVPDWSQKMLQDVLHCYPELDTREIRLRPFTSKSDYFEARFSFPRLLLGRKMSYQVLFNTDAVLLTCPEEARRAIIAHELAHVLYYSRRRMRLFGLVRLLRSPSRSRFERDADREAIRRGYSEGLKQYRDWVYQHVPASALPGKLRDYLSPAEIDAFKAGCPQCSIASCRDRSARKGTESSRHRLPRPCYADAWAQSPCPGDDLLGR